jgi:nitrate/nitrite transporter NarK
MNLGGRYAGTVSGSMNMMGNAGGAFFPIAFPYIRDTFGIDAVFYVSASAYIISFLAWQFLDSSKPITND